uniref:Movement protein n=1 Tax=Macrostomum lignano TaxID=282301 RepID=A0A1I8FPN0_9PLAT
FQAASVSSFVIQLNSYVKDADKSNQRHFQLSSAGWRERQIQHARQRHLGHYSGQRRLTRSTSTNGQRLYTLNVSAAELASNPGSLPGPLTGFRHRGGARHGLGRSEPGFEPSWPAAGHPASALEARDLDLGINQTVNYAIESGNVLNNATFFGNKRNHRHIAAHERGWTARLCLRIPCGCAS